MLVRDPSPVGFARASYELNLGCNYDCEHCYLGLKQFKGLSWADRERLLHVMRDAGVLYLQLKVGRDPYVSLLDEGAEGLRRLGAIADSLLQRTGGCSGCQLSGTCGTCRPLAKLYQEANAPLEAYCQHGRR